IAPALWILYIRRNVSDPDIYTATRRARDEGRISGHFLEIFSPPHLRATLFGSALCTGMLGGYYAITTWLPTYLKTVRHLSVFNTSGYLVVLIVGSFVGYVVGAILSDRLGRRASFILFAIGSFSLGMAYTMLPITDTAMLLLGFPLGIVVQGIFAGVGAYLSELYPGAIRGSGQGFCYNVGRAIGALFPFLIGALSKQYGLGTSIGIFAVAAYGVVIVAALTLPETRGRELDAA
ncbi:MFS transporter, partial [Burkholderia sp.]|uniref:MFS transporter n=1 Tax=Burkholderia sp. TaxID=36773 RepID=UPI002590E88F